MKRKITKAEFEALTDALKLIYVADGDGYKLPLVDDDDPDALRRARDREKQAAKDSKAALEAAQAELDALKTDPARKSGDIKTIEASWQQKLTTAETAAADRIKKLTGAIDNLLIDSATVKIAGAITKPENALLMSPHIKNRLAVEYDGDVPTIRVKDAAGKVSAMTLDELQADFVKNPQFANVIVGSKASGAGGNGGSGSSSNGGAGGTRTGKKLSELSEPERVQLHRENPDEFKRLLTEQQNSKFVSAA